MSSEPKEEVKQVGHEKMTKTGLVPDAHHEEMYKWTDPMESKVGHENVDTDVRRKALNRSRHSSYRKG